MKKDKELNKLAKEAELSGIKEELEQVKKENNDYVELLQRLQAEFENYQKRVEKEKEQVKLHSKCLVLLKLIEIKEDFERALKNIKEKEGIEMIYNNVIKTLKEENVREIEALGKKFDHNMHEAIKTVECKEEDNIIEEIQKGYLIGDKILRTSKVIVGKTIGGK